MNKLSTPITETILVVDPQSFSGIHRIQPHAAGLDIGAHEIWVCVPGNGNAQIVRLFDTYTADLHAIGKWLGEHDIRTVVMESTGVYWIPLFEHLEHQGFQCCLISSRFIKCLPGRKTDMLDCQYTAMDCWKVPSGPHSPTHALASLGPTRPASCASHPAYAEGPTSNEHATRNVLNIRPTCAMV